MFHWSTWYVWGWCRMREDFRLFKLNRMTDLAAGEPFEPKVRTPARPGAGRIFPIKYQVTVLFELSCRWRLVEEYGADRFAEEPDGRLRFTGGFPDADSVLSWVLTFGEKAELLEPEELREQLGALTKSAGASLQEELIWPLIRTLWTIWPSSCGRPGTSAAGRCSVSTGFLRRRVLRRHL